MNQNKPQSSEIHLTKEGKMYMVKTTRTEVPNPDFLFRGFAQRAGQMLPLFAQDSAMFVHGMDHFFAIKALNTLNFRLVAQVENGADDEPILVPTWQKVPEGGSMEKNLVFNMPKDNELLFMVEMKVDFNPKYKTETINIPNSYFLWVNTKDGKVYHVPFPNVHDNTRLCTGDINWVPNQGIERALESFFNLWSDNRWNADLLGEGSSEHWREFLKFDVETDEILPPGKNWRRKLTALRTQRVHQEVQQCIRSAVQFFYQKPAIFADDPKKDKKKAEASDAPTMDAPAPTPTPEVATEAPMEGTWQAVGTATAGG